MEVFNNKQDVMITLLLWVARIGSIFSIALVLLFFAGGHFNPAQVAWKEWIGLVFFPVGVVLGLVIAWKREALGGFISVLSVSAFYLVYGLILSGNIAQGSAFCMFAAPGAFFLIHWQLSHQATEVIAR